MRLLSKSLLILWIERILYLQNNNYDLRYILDISYKGTNYHGWQSQNNAHTVQAELNAAIFKLTRVEIATFGSGRTDTGVHALQQIVQFDSPIELDLHQFKYKLNLILPFDMSVNDIQRVSDTFSARFDASSRTYEYRITTKKDPFLKNQTFFFATPLDLEAMNQASEILFSYSDYKCFSKSRTQVNHFVCNIFYANWRREGDLLIFRIEANRFLRGMVRAIVGTMMEVGLQKISLLKFEEVIKSQNRSMAGMSVPPDGLFLVKVEYPLELI